MEGEGGVNSGRGRINSERVIKIRRAECKQCHKTIIILHIIVDPLEYNCLWVSRNLFAE